jgi:hypothetical protein
LTLHLCDLKLLFTNFLFLKAFEGEAPSEDNIVFLATQNVIWGGITMIQAELDMLSAAFQTGRWYVNLINPEYFGLRFE